MFWFLSKESNELNKVLKQYELGNITEAEYVQRVDEIRARTHSALENDASLDAVERKIIGRDLLAQERTYLWRKLDEVQQEERKWLLSRLFWK